MKSFRGISLKPTCQRILLHTSPAHCRKDKLMQLSTPTSFALSPRLEDPSMSLKQKRRVDCALIASLLALVGALAWARSQKPTISPEELLPADAVLYVGWSGIELQEEAYSRSALHD